MILPHSSHQLPQLSAISVSEEQQPSTSTFNLDFNLKVLLYIFLLFLKLCDPPPVVYFRILIPGAVFTEKAGMCHGLDPKSDVEFGFQVICANPGVFKGISYKVLNNS